jgi:DNA-binding NarL/FixJ family response regulator
MKPSTTSGRATRDEPRTRERTTCTVVAVALRDKALSVSLAAHLTADRDAVALLCPFSDPAALFPWLDENPADVLLLDEQWLHRFATGSVSRLRARWPDLRVLLVGDRACMALAEQVVRNRFQGFLLAKEAADACAKAVRTVKQGEMWLSRALLVQLLFEHIRAAGHGRLEADVKLTRREVEVIDYVRRGFANKKIAESLAIREDTVKKHLRNAYSKLGVHRRSEVITAVDRPLVSG